MADQYSLHSKKKTREKQVEGKKPALGLTSTTKWMELPWDKGKEQL